MAIKNNKFVAKELPTLNVIGVVSVGIRKDDGLYAFKTAFNKGPDGENTTPKHLVFQFNFDPVPGSAVPRFAPNRTWCTLHLEQFNPLADSSEFFPWQNDNFSRFFLPPVDIDGTPKKGSIALLDFLSEGDNSWMGKLESFYDSASGETDVQGIAAEIASHIDGKTIGFQLVQQKEKTGETDQNGKFVYALKDEYQIGGVFFNPEGPKFPKGQNTWGE